MLAYVGHIHNLKDLKAGARSSGLRQRPMRIPFSRFLPRSSVHGESDVIRKEAWPLYRTSSGVRLCWELEEPKGPKKKT